MKALDAEYWKPTEAWSTPESLEWLMLLESDSPLAWEAREQELARCKKDMWYWKTHWVKTEDAQNKENPFQPYPPKAHLRVLTEYWLRELYLLVPKSRQMTCTWEFVIDYLHDSMFWPSRNTIFQCKIEEDADANLKRALTVWEQLPWWMKEWQPLRYTHCNANFPRSRSHILAVPAGSKHYRQRTLTGTLVDEAAFTEGLREVLAAAKPALGKHGRFTGLSSAQPGEFKDLVFDVEN